MVARISGSIGAGALITAALIWWMQLMIEGNDNGWTPRNSYVPVQLVRIIEPPEPIDRTEPPPRPEPRTFPPDTPSFADPTTITVPPDDPVTPPGPPSPPTGPDGRSGPWILDRNLLPLTQIKPSYPAGALRRELEGHVIVEFTVTKRGDVSNARVVESTDRMFERQALAAVERSKYRPRVLDGSPVEVAGVTMRVEFRLED